MTDKPIHEISRYIESTLHNITVEISALQEWFRRDFPEARLTVNMDMNMIERNLTIQTKVFTGQEMSDNRGLFFNRIDIPERKFMDPMFIGKFLSVFNQEMRKSIALSVNNHYRMEKAKNG